MTKPRAAAKAAQLGTVVQGWIIGSAVAIAGAIAAGQALGQDVMIETHGYSSFGELAQPAGFTHLPYVNVDAPKGGEISIWTQGTFDHMNPWATQVGRPGALSNIAYERLMSSPADEVDVSYCYLCTTIEYPEDQSYVIFHLREDVTFSDGTPMTAHDVAFSHQVSITQFTPSFASVVSRMLPEVEVIDDHTIKFVLGADFDPNDAISQAGAQLVMPRAWFEETGAVLTDALTEMPPGTGPYMVSEFELSRRIVIGRNPYFWGAEHPMNVGHYNFDQIRVEYFADTTAAFEAFKAGEYTFRLENSSLTWATGYDFPALNDGYVVQETIPNGALPRAGGFVFNLERERFQDRRVRQALGLMYNFTWTNETLQYGLFEQRESFWQGSDLQARGVAEGLELEYLTRVADLIDPSILTDTVTVPHTSSDRQLDRGNLRLASDLLDEAGWLAGDDGMRRNAAGEVLVLEFLSPTPSYDRIVLPYIAALERLGVEATYNRVDPSQYSERTRSFQFDMIIDGYTMGLVEGESLGQRFGSASAVFDEDGIGNVFNPAHYRSEAVDALIQIVIEAETLDEMHAAVRAIDRVMRYDLFIVPNWYLADHWAAYFDMYRHPEVIPPYALGYLDFWWYDEEAAQRLRDAGAIR